MSTSAFTLLPLGSSADTKISLHSFVKQFWLALREKYICAGNFFWPRSGRIWESGTVPSNITETTFQDVSKVGTWDTTKDNPWVGVNKLTPDVDTMPTSWSVCFDDCDYEKVIIANITGINNDGTLTYANIRDNVTGLIIPSVASLIGKKYYIIRSTSTYGIFWNQRLIEFPNDFEWGEGTVRQYNDDLNHPTTITNPTHTTIKDDQSYWIASQIIGKDLLFYADDGFLKRVVIISADDNLRTITFATQSWTPITSSPYTIVSTGGRAIPGKSAVNPFIWYRGNQIGYYTHTANDTIGSASLPTQTIFLTGADSLGGCGGYFLPTWDTDTWAGDSAGQLSLDDANCGAANANRNYAQDLYKALRGLHIGFEEVSELYLQKKSYENVTPALMNPAVQFYSQNINAFSGTTTTVDSPAPNTSNTINLSGITIPNGESAPIRVYWAIVDQDGFYTKYGRGVLNSTSQLTGELRGGITDWFEKDLGDGTPHDEGKTIILSLGWSQIVPREFKYFYDVSAVLIPDLDGIGGVIDPPTITDFATDGCVGAGTWYDNRPASTKYIERRQKGTDFTALEGFAEDTNGDSFTSGDLAVFVGDNAEDPSVRDTADSPTFTSNPQNTYYDHFFVGKSKQVYQNSLDGQREGYTTDGTQFSFTDTTQDWYNYQWFSGTSHVESGTFTSGSTTSGTDSSKASGAGNCFWASSRFVGFSSPYYRFVVEVLISGSDWNSTGRVIEKRLITVGTTSGQLTWSEPLSASASGKQYRIQEPYKLNRYRQRSCVLSSPNGFSQTVVITGNDATTCFFTPPVSETITKGWTYKIIEPVFGGVYKRSGSSWIAPSGADSVRLTVTTPANFHNNVTENRPTIVRRYGRMVLGDIIGNHTFDEMYRVACDLVMTRSNIVWTNDPSYSTPAPENNAMGWADGNEEDFPQNGPLNTNSGISFCGLKWFTDNGSNSFPTDAEGWQWLWEVVIPGKAQATGSVDAYGCNTGQEPYSSIAGGYYGDGYVGALAYGTTAIDGQAPYCYTTGELNGGGMTGTAARVYSYAKTTIPQPHCPYDNEIEYTAKTRAWNGGRVRTCTHSGDDFDTVSWLERSFDANSDNVIENSWHIWFEDSSPTTVEKRVSGPLGVNHLNDPPHSPLLPTPDVGCLSVVTGNPPAIRTASTGYEVIGAYAIVNWEVAGGMQYITSGVGFLSFTEAEFLSFTESDFLVFPES